ncbi:F-box/LRR-repeat protein, partial [Tanacetum coccineum]
LKMDKRKWEDMHNDILVKIFQTIHIVELTPGIGQVCRSWRDAASDPIMWRTLDLSMMKSYYIRMPSYPYIFVGPESDKLVTKVLKNALILSRGNISALFFHVYLFVSEEQFAFTAERCPRLKRLVLPAWDRITRPALYKAISMWKDLESLTMPSISDPFYIMDEISKNCKNFSQLKIMGRFGMSYARALAICLPNLKVLSLRCTMLLRDALIKVLDGLKHLKVLNISHCILVEILQPSAPKKVFEELDEEIIRKARHIRQFITCMNDVCVMCKRTRLDKGLLRWFNYEEGIWKEDEVSFVVIDLQVGYYQFCSVLTVVALGVAGYYVVSGKFGGSSSYDHDRHERSRSFEEGMQPLKLPVQLGEISEEELKGYDGNDVKKPILMAIKGHIYDVSESRIFYGPGGPYALFAGKDASRALAKMSFEEKDLNGDLTGLGVFELEALQDWENKFMRKYVKVGSIKKPELTPEPSTTTDRPAESYVAEATESNTMEPADHVSNPTEDSPSEVATGETKEETTAEADKQE